MAESTFPLSRFTPLSRFIERSEEGRVAVSRLNQALTAQQRFDLYVAAQRRVGIVYDTGFNLHSSRQFCSKYVRQVVFEATGQQLGEVETFAAMLTHNPQVRLGFWKVWYFGRIPWQRESLSPVSVMRSPLLHPVFDGSAVAIRRVEMAL